MMAHKGALHASTAIKDVTALYLLELCCLDPFCKTGCKCSFVPKRSWSPLLDDYQRTCLEDLQAMLH